MKRGLLLAGLMLLSLACRNDDDSDVIRVPPRPLSEVAAENDADIVAFLQSHFYNYEEFLSPPADFDYKVRIDTIAGANADKTPMIDQVRTEIFTINSSSFGRDDGERIQHTLYYLIARQGVGTNPTIGDNTVLRYEGSLLNGNLFDAANSPVNQYLSSTVRGYGNGVTHFRGGEGPFENGDGTVSFDNYGIGILLIPSGLAYFDSPPGNLPSYSPLIFKIDVLTNEVDTDFDEDGIPSILEDLNGDGNLNSDNTDGDFSQFGPIYNHLDEDDDNDGIPTRDEIEIDDEGVISFPDSDGDGTADYLDNDTTG